MLSKFRIFFYGIAVALALGGGVAGVLKLTVDTLTHRDATAAAVSWARYVAENVVDIDDIARGAQASAESMQFFVRSQQIRQVFGFEIIDLNGNVQLSSDGVKIVSVHGAEHNKAAEEAAKLGQPIVSVKEGVPPIRPRYYSEAFLPVVVDGEDKAIVAAYVDLSEQHDRFREAFLFAALAICMLTGVAVGFPSIAWYRRTKEKEFADERIRFLAHHDALTGLANRSLFTEKIDEALTRLSQLGETFAITLLDLDRFKSVNDSLGHPAGDALLKAAAKRLKSCVRETDLVARLGGDEFAILQIAQNFQKETAIALANRIQRVVASPYEIEGREVTVGTSLGIALAPTHGTRVDQLLKRADLALYAAKSVNPGGFCCFESSFEENATSRQVLETELHTALSLGQFELYFQPVINFSTRAVHGAEALVRWNHPRRGLIPPHLFIPVAEEIGLIVELGEWIVRSAFATAAGWASDIKVAVNLSPVQFGHGDLIDVVARALADFKLSPSRVELEITESVLLHDNAENIALLQRLKGLGVSIVLDDFGTGYSSLSYLKLFPFDLIKIDRSFVNELTSRADCASIVSAIIGLGRGLNIATTAEGVETEEQYELLRVAGCTLGQGFLLGRPVSALAFAAANNLGLATRAA